jgi:hypothetical protein
VFREPETTQLSGFLQLGPTSTKYVAYIHSFTLLCKPLPSSWKNNSRSSEDKWHKYSSPKWSDCLGPCNVQNTFEAIREPLARCTVCTYHKMAVLFLGIGKSFLPVADFARGREEVSVSDHPPRPFTVCSTQLKFIATLLRCGKRTVNCDRWSRWIHRGEFYTSLIGATLEVHVLCVAITCHVTLTDSQQTNSVNNCEAETGHSLV